MKTLFVYSIKQLGYDPVVGEFAQALADHRYFNGINIAVEAEDMKGLPDEEFDNIILMDSSKFYLDHKLKIKGRPWVCYLSFCFEPNVTFMALPINETGITVVFSNCAHFVSQISHVMPAMFYWRPLPANLVPTNTDRMIGCVLPNIVDRDFCLLDLAASAMNKAGRGDKFVIYTRDNDDWKLPDSLEKYRKPYSVGGEAAAYQSIKFYIPAPRITDYRVGIVPPEIIRACAYGCQPLLIYHPALAPLQKIVNPIVTSLKDYKDHIKDICEVKEGTKFDIVTTSIPKEWKVTAVELVNTIAMAHQRWKANAS